MTACCGKYHALPRERADASFKQLTVFLIWNVLIDQFIKEIAGAAGAPS